MLRRNPFVEAVSNKLKQTCQERMDTPSVTPDEQHEGKHHHQSMESIYMSTRLRLPCNHVPP